MKRHAVELLPLCLAACLFVACQSESAPTSTPPPAPAARATTRWVPQHRDATTSQAVAVRHLDDRIAEVERLLRHRPGDVKLTARLVGELSIQASRLGQLVALDRMVALGEGAVTQHPDDPKAYALRARVRAAVHRFDEALADLDAAVERGLPASDTVGSRASILLGLGRYDEALRAAEEAETQRATSANVAVVAAILGHMERYADAEARFRQAEALYRGVNPFDLAWIYFTWGQMWEHAGKVEEAALRYRAALDRLPGYAHAAGHLAGSLPDDEAVPLLEGIVASSDDPEYRAALASLRERREPGTGRALLAEATAGFAGLMTKHPHAFADHAGWFYLRVDPDRAVEVAELNLKARQPVEAYELLLAALSRAGESDEACRRADEALGRPYGTPALRRRAADAYRRCGRADEAEGLATPTRI
ncbi:MAG: hypothetical protein KC731_36205 [Myxococcales bacterium]|nr:hypothetical protein [Myxococcales bacterium]